MTVKLLNIKEVSQRIHLSPATIRTYRVMHPHRVPPFAKYNERLVILESDLNDWIVKRYGGQK